MEPLPSTTEKFILLLFLSSISPSLNGKPNPSDTKKDVDKLKKKNSFTLKQNGS